MAAYNKEHGIKGFVKEGLSYVSTIVSANIFPIMAEGAEMVMRTIEKRILRLEKRIVRNISSLLIIGFGSIFLIFSLFFFLIEQLSWTTSAAFFFIGIIIFITGFLLRLLKN